LRNKIYKIYDLGRALLVLIGVNIRLDTLDRKILENSILPILEDKNEDKFILNVGANWYTKNYSSIFKKNKYIELEINWWRFQFCSSDIKINGDLLNLPICFEFDYIILNGVFSYGINSKKQIEEAVQVCNIVLATDGIILLGGNINKNLKFVIQAFTSAGFKNVPDFFVKDTLNICKKYKFVALSKQV
jgi:hypothetical protein